jgi:hypothetical protein
MDKQREKLVELITKGSIEFANSVNIDGYMGYMANYLLANGVIVPPCKVGDTFYVASLRWKPLGEKSHWERQVEKFVVDHIRYDGECLFLDDYSRRSITLNDIGKTVFLSREDAEKALKGEQK